MIDEAAVAQLRFRANNHWISVFPLMLIIRKQTSMRVCIHMSIEN
jgi:hypothetical protein